MNNSLVRLLPVVGTSIDSWSTLGYSSRHRYSSLERLEFLESASDDVSRAAAAEPYPNGSNTW